jgi:hypothetical protein
MKKVTITIRFFKEHWPEVLDCAKRTAELWQELMKLAPKLAEELREAK